MLHQISGGEKGIGHAETSANIYIYSIALRLTTQPVCNNSHTTPDRLILFLPDPCRRSPKSAVPWLRLYTHLMHVLRADCPAHLIVLSVRRVQLSREPDSSLTPY